MCGEYVSPTFVLMKKGFAFARFANPEDAQIIVDNLNKTTYQDQSLRVELAREPVCYICNKEGHFARSCPQKNSAVDNAQRQPDPSMARPEHRQEVYDQPPPVVFVQRPHCRSCTCYNNTAPVSYSRQEPVVLPMYYGTSHPESHTYARARAPQFAEFTNQEFYGRSRSRSPRAQQYS